MQLQDRRIPTKPYWKNLITKFSTDKINVVCASMLFNYWNFYFDVSLRPPRRQAIIAAHCNLHENSLCTLQWRVHAEYFFPSLPTNCWQQSSSTWILIMQRMLYTAALFRSLALILLSLCALQENLSDNSRSRGGPKLSKFVVTQLAIN